MRVAGSEFFSRHALGGGHPQTGARLGRAGDPSVPFHGFAPAIKFLGAVISTPPSSQIFSLVFSFPLPEDLAVITCSGIGTDNRGSSQEDEMPMSHPGLLGPPGFI